MSLAENYNNQASQTVDNILAVVDGLDEEVIKWKPDEDIWSILQILAHVEEANYYWINELERVVVNRGGEWGRTLTHEGRLKAVKKAGERSAADVIEGVKKSRDYVNKAFSQLSDDDLKVEAPHRNPKFGTKPMTFLVEHFITEHLEKHYSQISRNIAQYKQQAPTQSTNR